MGMGMGRGRGEGGRGGGGQPFHFRLQQHDDGIMRFITKQACFVKAYYRPFVGCDRSILDCSNIMTVLCVSCAKRPVFC